MAQLRIKSPLLLLLGLLLLLIPIFAWLQWRWIGEISDREAERLRINVRTTSTYAAWNFNQRLMGLQQAFTLPAETSDSAIAEELSDAWNLWKQHNDSHLVASVYFVRAPGHSAYRLDLPTKQLSPISDSLLASIGIDLEKAQPITISRVTKSLRALILPMFPANMGNRFSSGTGYFSRTNPPQDAPPKDSLPNGAQRSNKSMPLVVPKEIARGLPQQKAPQQKTPPDGNLYHGNRQQRPSREGIIFSAPGNFSMSYIIVVPDSAYLRKHFLPSIIQQYFHEREYRWAVIQSDDSTLLSSSEPILSPREMATPDFTTVIGFIPPRPPGRMGRTMAALTSRMPLILATESDSILQKNRAQSSPVQNPARTSGADSLALKEFFGTTELRVVAARGSLAREVEAFRWRNVAVSFGALLVLAGGLVVVFAAVARSERLARQQMQFVAGVSHELRTPLAVLHSASENLSDGIVKTPEQARRYGQVMKREITRLVEMVEQTLTFAGIQSGKRTFEFQPTDVQTLIEDCLERNATFLQGENCAPEIHVQSGLPPIHADSRALGSVLDNLLANAVKYSVGGCTVRITSSIVGKELVIAVQDSGRGIAAKEQKSIFEPFYRTRETIDAQIHGNGLGLSIVQHIVKQHGGFVQVVSELGKGSTFSVHFPLAKQFALPKTTTAETLLQQPET